MLPITPGDDDVIYYIIEMYTSIDQAGTACQLNRHAALSAAWLRSLAPRVSGR